MHVATMSNVQIADELLRRLREGEVEAAAELVHVDFEIQEPLGLPYGGRYHGPDGFVELFERLTSIYEFEIHEWRVEPFGRRVVGLIETSFALHGTPGAIEMPILEIYDFTDGLLSHAMAFPQDTKLVADLAVPDIA